MFSLKTIMSIFYHHSSTKCLFLERSALKHLSKLEWDNYSYKIFSNPEDIANLSFDRLKLLPYRQWLKNGSVVIVVFREAIPVAFGWTHFVCHSIQYVGTFDMGNHIAWLGPSFVHKEFRGKGLQKLVIQLGVAKAPTGVDCFITSVNAKNVPSLSSFLKLGFEEGLDISMKKGLLCKSSKYIKEISPKSKFYLNLQQ